jgi:hypothetical protein
MSAVPVSLSSPSVPRAPAEIVRSGPIPQPATPAVHWELTDRGIAVVMVVAAMILTAALIVVGVTAVRVTSPDNGVQESRRLNTEIARGAVSADVAAHLVDADGHGK